MPIPEGEQRRCKCGKLIINDDKRLRVYHEEPACDWFNRMIAEVSAAANEAPVITRVVVDDGRS